MKQLSQPLQFKILGMDCVEEVTLLKREIGPKVGGEDHLAFDILQGKMTVLGPDPSVTAERVIQAVADAGLRAEMWSSLATGPETEQALPIRSLLVSTSGLATVAGFLTHAIFSGDFWAALGNEGLGDAAAPPLVSRLLYGVAILAGIWLVLPKAFQSAKRLRPDMNLLMTVAVAGAMLIGEWLEAAMVAFLFAVSNLLESWSIGRARRAIAALLDLSPPVVRVRSADGTESDVSPDQVVIGTVFIVRPGERIPLDGRLARGTSEVNEASLTGESRPVEKNEDDKVFAGTINGNGALEIESTARAEDTMLAHIIRLVEDAQSRRAPSEQWVESFARFYTPAVMALAVLVFLAAPLLFGQTWYQSFYNALVLLVIACPCALVISTPVSVVSGLAAAADCGVLIKGGVHLEMPAKLSALAFDKTGTLTVGEPAVTKVVPLSGHDERELLEIAAALEARSDHPLAKAILAYAQEQGVSPAPAEDMQIVQGKGATALLNGQPYWIGSHKYLEERGKETPEVHDILERLSAEGNSVVVIGNDQHVCGFFALADKIRPQAPGTLKRLRDLGIRHLVMLTGDNRGTAQSIAKQVGVDDVRAELLPHQKVEAIEKLVAEYGTVGMVGDGVNDAPALARSTLGIAMGAAGSDAALETADIALMADDLAQMPWLIQHSRRTLAIIRQNIWFSLIVKGATVVLTFAGVATLWVAIAADMGASLIVIFNGLRLLRSGRQP